MTVLLRLGERIDALSDCLGRLLAWLAVILVLVGVLNVLARFLGAQLGVALASNGMLEFQSMLFNLLILFGAVWVLRLDGHLRVDVLRSRWSPRCRAWIDIVGILFLLAPFCLFVVFYSLDFVVRSWAHLELSANPGGLPRYPVKTLIPVAFSLLLLQGASELIKRLAWLRGHTGAWSESNRGRA
ncbi:TRAP transporter small permease subunit [Methylonatrum kenyense]|uniref:TRAP transporter small permease subunit n=1 Tax=Methylonatrum kenyense TaxID=455253 RepID=UPI0020BF611D|nr:TRAP transporter small permease subunit [Methylonatrum kenyense]MCK8515591.1 TRAP transporter small permease subunit [Methylonatrum kenyense]